MPSRAWSALFAALLTLAGCGSQPEPEGEKLATTALAYSRSLAQDDGDIYWLDWEQVEAAQDFGDSPRGVAVLKTIPKTGGEPRELYRSSLLEHYVRGELAVDDSSVFWLEHCAVLDATCARLLAMPKSGGVAPTELVRDDIYAFALAGADIVYSVSDEYGLQMGYPDGHVDRVAKAGGAPVTLASGLRYLRQVAADAEAVYWVTATALPTTAPLGVTRLPTGGPPVLLAETRGPPIGLLLRGDQVLLSMSDGVDGVAKSGGPLTPLASWSYQTSAADVAVDERGVSFGVYFTWEGETVGGDDDHNGTYHWGKLFRVADGAAPVEIAGDQDHPSLVIVDATRLFWASSGGEYSAGSIRTIAR